MIKMFKQIRKHQMFCIRWYRLPGEGLSVGASYA